MEKQFSSTIKQLQSNGGGEYTSNIFQSFLTKNRIIHRKSCPYTSQENDLTERKLRQILETSLTLLAHSHLSNKYWVDAFLTSVYLINRLPTPTLDNVSPFFKLHKKEPNYQQLKVFGCKFYPLLHPFGLHKLEFRSKPCIFFGYCYAGYKCLDPITNKVYLSRHVVFDEQTFSAKDEVPIQLPFKVNATGDLPFIPHVSSFLPTISHTPPTAPINFVNAETNHVDPHSPLPSPISSSHDYAKSLLSSLTSPNTTDSPTSSLQYHTPLDNHPAT